MDELVEVIGLLRSNEERARFLTAFLSRKERQHFGKRWEVFAGLLSGRTQRDVQAETGAGMATVSRASSQLQDDAAILHLVYDRLVAQDEQRMNMR